MIVIDRRYAAAVCFAVGALAWLLMPGGLSAQQSTPPPPPRRPSPSNQPAGAPSPNRTIESVNQRALDLEMLSTVGRRDRSAESINRRLANQLAEDLERLRQIDIETIAPLSAVESVDYKKLSQATAEIKQRATRIRYSIALPLEEKREKIRYEADPIKIGLMLSELDRLMKSFYGNPVFRINSPDDAELRSAAAQDLQAIIKLSETVRKVAKSLNKSASQNK